ncbi:MAG: hypothetical protein KDB53_05420 [Planctomycetes bacterium]|nr:hypothetical protein [Planctomycetota bacterium]
MTLLDMVVALMILAIVLSGLYAWLYSTTRAAGTVTVRTNLNLEATRAVEKVSREILSAGVSTLFPSNPSAPLGTSQLTYQKGQGWGASGKVWSAPMRIELRFANGEIDDGIDNNGDGLVDEGTVYLILDANLATEREMPIATNVKEYFGDEEPNAIDDNDNGLVDERGLSFELRDDQLTIRLSLIGVLPGGSIIRSDVEQSVRMRN